MAKVYSRPGGFEGLFPPTQADRIIGHDEGKRSTKTFIRGEKSAIILALIKNHAENHARAIQALHAKENPDAAILSRLEMQDLYPGVRAWDSLHLELVEHYASLEGFSLRVVARVVQLSQDANQQLAESSLKPEGQGGGKTNGVIKHAGN